MNLQERIEQLNKQYADELAQAREQLKDKTPLEAAEFIYQLNKERLKECE